MKKVRLLIDVGSVKTGGGVQLALNFLRAMKRYPADIEKVYLLVPECGPLSNRVDISGYDGSLMYPNSYWKRKIFEMTRLQAFVARNRINVFYTFFGAGIPAPRGVRSIISVAYPIICYPDSPYWSYLSGGLKYRAHIRNYLRCRRIRMADKVIAETEVMAKRLIEYVSVAPDRLAISPPSPTAFVRERCFRSRGQTNRVRILLLGGLDRHKNIWRLPALVKALEAIGLSRFVFLVSATREAFGAACPEYRGNELLFKEHCEFIGVIPSDQIDSVYERADILMNLSDLESFSNNYMEAWKAGLPLICSDTDFARHICGKAAVYVDPHNPQSAAQVIKGVIESEVIQQEVTSAGKLRLSMLPTVEDKFAKTMQIIREVM